MQEETRGGSGVTGGTANRFLQVIADGFQGGRAFTAKELAAEAKSSESAARAGVKLLRKRGYVHEYGRELTQQGKPGATPCPALLATSCDYQSLPIAHQETVVVILSQRQPLAAQ